ncbi:SDR family NAD(P)-dependent oxidoreductase [Paenibacillus polymyxa]|uniref:SDR family NAD(P)-dependent oxidoreductase n=3 Tax=Paenibacillus TaxID=44249 RepID=UPI002019FBDC|nr:SDR family NAD(P)-dependent oxidoreductase [Paenibacillus polymyxa]UQQ34206.1 SDR family NAD(P)-dependent oxidoreductase [Paenibacillus polymyxa]
MTSTMMLEPRWKEQAITEKRTLSVHFRHVVMLCEMDPAMCELIDIQLNGTTCISLQTEQTSVEERYQAYTVQVFETIQQLIQDRTYQDILVQIIVSREGEGRLFTGLAGILKTAQLEYPKLSGQLIEVDPNEDENLLIQKITENKNNPSEGRIRYINGKRQVMHWKFILENESVQDWLEQASPWRDGGLYLLTGGTGGLGKIFAREIAESTESSNIILMGHSPLDESKKKWICELQKLGAHVVYKNQDLNDKEGVVEFINTIEREYGHVNGIIHSAGIIQDDYIVNKSSEEFRTVLAPKVSGLLCLDEATKGMQLDFIILFSSVAGALGNPGQVDYATANAFLDAYASYRNDLQELGFRHGRTLSINWPLWREGGMQIDESIVKILEERTGMSPISTETGISAFYKAFSLGQEQIMLIQGNRLKIADYLKKSIGEQPVVAVKKHPVEVDHEQLMEKTLSKLKSLLAEEIKWDEERINIFEPLESYGIDSILILQLNQKLEHTFGECSKTIFYEYRTLQELALYFISNFKEACILWTGLTHSYATPKKSLKTTKDVQQRKTILVPRHGVKRKSRMEITSSTDKEADPIAIIGISGRYPQADHLQEFWSNLVSGKDCITELDEERWELDSFYHPDREEAILQNKSYSKWGGFVQGFADFDPLFFNISPREAMSMDPQERLFIQACWEALEDAAYTREQLKTHHQGRVGVFAGITKTGFNLYGPDMWKKGETLFPHTSFSSLANRVSYLLNLNGPSMPIDTMCSSSLTAIHEACEHLRHGQCEVAIAGAVNLYLHPSSYVQLCGQHMLSVDGKCKSFGQDANGFVPGEGVGVFILKPLSKARADKDHIYGCIRGTSINHGGKTNGYTVPNPSAQAELIQSAIDRAGVDARAISYIEAHGTGTLLGDPIEITGLTQAFRTSTKQSQFCAIGSVKSNIGHLEAAAGMAGMTKILLQMKHQKIVPTLHATQLNSNIPFSDTPFVVQRKLSEWNRPVVEKDGKRKEYPRIAGISSFGAGGANAHVIMEEYTEPVEAIASFEVNSEKAIVVLSAKNEDRLFAKVHQLLTFIEEGQIQDDHLRNMAYTLQIGREAMEERLGLMVGSVKELKEKLKLFYENKSDFKDIYRGRSKRNKESVMLLLADEDMRKAVSAWIQKKKYTKLLDLWVKGVDIDWTQIYEADIPKRISLPVYPFAKERYWISERSRTDIKDSVYSSVAGSTYIHPLLHRNTSDLTEQRYSSIFTGEEFFLTDHQIRGHKVLPGVAHLEMARKAAELATNMSSADQLTIKIKNVVWASPVMVDTLPVEVHIGLYMEDKGEIGYTIYRKSEDGTDNFVNSQGRIEICTNIKTQSLDISSLQADCNQTSMTGAACYEAFEEMGYSYGEGHRGIEELYVGTGQVLAKLRLPSVTSDSGKAYVLHPGLVDSALQATIGLFHQRHTGNNPLLPFALQEIHIIQPCTSIMWARIRYSEGYDVGSSLVRVDLDICNFYGDICIEMKGLTSRILKEEITVESNITTLMLSPVWKQQTIEQAVLTMGYTKHVVLLCEPEERWIGPLRKELRDAVCVPLFSKAIHAVDRYQDYALQALGEVQKIIRDQANGQVLVQIVAFNPLERYMFTGLLGLLKTAQIESSKIIGQMLEIDAVETVEQLISMITENAQFSPGLHVRYYEDRRWISEWEEIDRQVENTKPWKDNGIYLITGGAGGLGLVFCEEIVRNSRRPTVILVGRSPLDELVKSQLTNFKTSGARVLYKRIDITDRQAVRVLMESIQEEYGTLNGIIHSAGVIYDSFILNKQTEEVMKVMAPKVAGTVYLDEESKEFDLDFFVLFSSVAGILGNAGQSDYAMANLFMDSYAEYRSALEASCQRKGQTLVMDWPLWRDGGMRMDTDTEKSMLQNTGMQPISIQTGLDIFYQAMSSGRKQIMGIYGQASRMRDKLFSLKKVKIKPIQPLSKAADDTEKLLHEVLIILAETISNVLDVSAKDIDDDAEWGEYGFDSISLTQLANRLNQAYELDLTPALFFEYSGIREFAKYLLLEHRDSFNWQASEHLGHGEALPELSKTKSDLGAWKWEETAKFHSRRMNSRFVVPALQEHTVLEPVAIIGISGIFPMAKNVDELWQNLVQGRDCITKIPREREEWGIYDLDLNAEVPWGGFISGVDEFDALFFGITPREAELMDPQQRLLMTYVWNVLEDAGYSARAISGTGMGLFVGTGRTGYSELLSKSGTVVEGYSSTGKVPSIGPNRMSYFLDIHGPSEPIETACSSSLIAVHRAVQAIRNGDCETAVAGGVNTLLSSEDYKSFYKAGMLSRDGRCKTFSDQANGYVRSEGVGMVLLKKLKDAELDGDQIYAVIRATGENHGGRANSLTAPNPKSQAKLLNSVYQKAGIRPDTVGYIEAHGSGTPLGDPIEINALKQAFQELGNESHNGIDKSGYCGLGTVKTNIGHLELAAGIVGLIKVVLQMKHQTLVKNLHLETVNPYIELEDSPFYIVQETCKWEPLLDDEGKELPRRAGVSSFGFGGANAHVLVEEYIPQENQMDHFGAAPRTPVMIVLSGKDEQRLQEQVLQLLEAMEQGNYGDDRLESIAYTLQVGREAMEERLGLIVESVSDLAAQLREYAEHQKAGRWFCGNVKRYKETISALEADEDMQETIRQWIYKGKYAKLLDLWVKGLSMNWQALYGEKRPLRISLPTYPFARDRYWVPQAEGKEATGRSWEDTDSRWHPLLHRNVSVLSEQRYASTFSGEEFFLTDHRVQGRKMLPGVAYLEMARTAVEQALEVKPGGWLTLQLQQVTWIQPITVEEQPVEVRLRLMAGEEGDIGYEIYKGSTGATEDVVYSQGTARVVTNVENVQEDITKRIAEHRAAGAQEVPITACYEAFAAMGIEYGAGQRSLESVQAGAGQVWARVSLPPSVSATAHDYVLHPSLMDGALQAAIGLTLLAPQENTAGAPALPFSLGELTVYGPCTSQMWVHMSEEGEQVQEERVQKRRIDVYDDTGRLCVSLRGFTSRLQGGGSRSLTQSLTYPLEQSEVEVAAETVIVMPVWEPCRVIDGAGPSGSVGSGIVLIGGSRERREAVMAYYPQAQVVPIQTGEPVEDIQGKLEACGSIRHVIWIGPEAEISAMGEKRIIEGQEEGVIQLFRLVKSMLHLGYGQRTLEWTVITVQAQPVNKYDEVDPTHASVHGFIGSMAKEYSHWGVRLADMEAGVEWPWSELLSLPPNAEGDGLVYREGEWYRQELVPVTMEMGYPTRYRHGGVYVVIGGAGGLGTVWSEYMIRTYQAQIVWIGRRAEDEAIRGKRERLAEIGAEPMYIAADAMDETALGEACRTVRQAYGDIHGVVHSAIVLSDRSLGQMEEEEFCKSLQAKVDVSVHLARAFQGEALDFVLFFSSFNAFTKAAGQSNYVSGCTFKDAFAHQLSVEWSCEVKVVNWGYWGQVGVVSGERYRKQMERLGIQSIRTEEGMQILEQLVSGQLHQLGVMRTTDPLGIKEVNWGEFITI